MSTLGKSKISSFCFWCQSGGMRKKMSPRFLLLPQGFESFPSDLPLMLLWVMNVGFENTCTISRKWNVSRVIRSIYRWIYKILRLSPLAVEHRVVVMTAGSQSRQAQMEFYWLPIFNFLFIDYVLIISGDIKFWDPSWELRHWESEFN